MFVSFLIENELQLMGLKEKGFAFLVRASEFSIYSGTGAPASKSILRGDFTITSSEVTVAAGAILQIEGTADGVDHVVVAIQGLRPSWKIVNMVAPEWGQMCCEWEDLPPTKEQVDEAYASAYAYREQD